MASLWHEPPQSASVGWSDRKDCEVECEVDHCEERWNQSLRVERRSLLGVVSHDTWIHSEVSFGVAAEDLELGRAILVGY